MTDPRPSVEFSHTQSVPRLRLDADDRVFGLISSRRIIPVTQSSFNSLSEFVKICLIFSEDFHNLEDILLGRSSAQSQPRVAHHVVPHSIPTLSIVPPFIQLPDHPGTDTTRRPDRSRDDYGPQPPR